MIFYFYTYFFDIKIHANKKRIQKWRDFYDIYTIKTIYHDILWIFY